VTAVGTPGGPVPACPPRGRPYPASAPLHVLPILLGLAMVVACTGPEGSTGSRSGAVITTIGSVFRGAETDLSKPEVTLTDTDGEPFDLAADTTGDVTLIFFGYTSCPDVCTIVLRQVAAGLKKLDEATRQQIEVVFITTDPARDTPEAITAYLERFDFASYVGLTGSVSSIEQAAAPLQVKFYTDDEDGLPGGPYEVVHGAHVIGFAHDGRAVLWTKDTSVADLAHDFALLAASAPQ
jgi:protein SCO1/2